MIPSGFNSTFWERVLDGARAEAEKQDAYVELAGQGFSDDMTETELLDMAYYSYTDGIILYPEDSPDVETEINKIVESGIPVITVGKDSQDRTETASWESTTIFSGRPMGGSSKNASVAGKSARRCSLSGEKFQRRKPFLVYAGTGAYG